jgi:hypothetical protein
MDNDVSVKLARVRWHLAALRVEHAMLWHARALRNLKYDPNQLRVRRGTRMEGSGRPSKVRSTLLIHLPVEPVLDLQQSV